MMNLSQADLREILPRSEAESLVSRYQVLHTAMVETATYWLERA